MGKEWTGRRKAHPLQLQWVLSPQKELKLKISQRKLGVVVNACDPSAWEIKAGDLGIHSWLWLSTKFKASLSYVRPCLKNPKVNNVS